MIEKVKNGLVSGFANLSVILTTLAVWSSQERKYDKIPSNKSKYLRIHRSRLPPSLAMLQENFGFVIIEGMPHINKLLISFAAVFKVIIDVNE